MRNTKRSQALWDYLNASGVLDSGDDQLIQQVKQAYRKQYFLEFKRRQRAQKAEFTVVFSKDNGEFERIRKAATRHKMSVSAFVKQATLAYLDFTYVVPNAEQIARLEQLLSDCLNEIKTIVLARERFWERESKLEKIDLAIERMETLVNETLRYPTLRQSDDRQNQIA